MQYTLKRIVDIHPDWLNELRQKCFAVNGCCVAVHKELGPFLNEYMYQEALKILFDEYHVPYQKEYYFNVVLF